MLIFYFLSEVCILPGSYWPLKSWPASRVMVIINPHPFTNIFMHNQGHLDQTTSLPKFQWSQLFDNSDIENIHHLFTKIVTFSWNISQHHKKSKMPTICVLPQPVRSLVQAGFTHLCPAIGNVDVTVTDELMKSSRTYILRSARLSNTPFMKGLVFAIWFLKRKTS